MSISSLIGRSFAWVIAILITLGGVIAITTLGIESYPSIAPPQVVVSANYPAPMRRRSRRPSPRSSSSS
jgi:multidrug efflux pump subunit AcrB